MPDEAKPPQRRLSDRLGDLANETGADFELAVQRLRQTEPGDIQAAIEALWIGLGMLGRQISQLRHDLNAAESRNQAAYTRLHWRIAGDPDGKEVGGAIGELRDQQREINARFQSYANLVKILGGAILSIITFVLATAISGHLRIGLH